MKRTVTLALAAILSMPLLSAQEGINCGTPEVAALEIPASEMNHCFDVSEVQSSCAKIWLRVNVHFFVPDDCEGSIYPGGHEQIPIKDAYLTAEDLINRCNLELEENYIQWNQIPFWGINAEKPAQCVPFRYALSGVYVHCDTDGMNTSGANHSALQNNFGVNTNTEYNAYFVVHPTATGQASGIPGNSFTSENFWTGVFNHEMGHLLRLEHSWLDDGIDDTPLIHFQYDFNCDGDLNDFFPSPGVGWEGKPRQCYFFWSDAPDRSLDYDGDGIVDYPDYCDIANPDCADYPCCDWKYINNNIMAYSSYIECCAAYTEGQITRALENLSTETYCEYIEVITDDACPPPMPNIHILPNEDADDCAYCLQIGASMHDAQYKLDFFAPSGTLQFSTGWRDGPAWQYCISRSLRDPLQYRHGFQPGLEYTVVLTVANECSEESSKSISFTLPQLPGDGCLNEIPKVKIRNLYPNPFTNIINIEYEAEEPGTVTARLVPGSGANEVVLGSVHLSAAGVYTDSWNAQSVPNGIYYFVLDLNGNIAGSTILKL